MKNIFIKRGLLGLVFGICTGAAQADGIDYLLPRENVYVLRIARTASHQLKPGDYVEIAVTSGPMGERSRETVVKKVQVIKISELTTNIVALSLATNRRQVNSMHVALSRPEPAVALRIIKKQPRPPAAAVPDDGLPDLDFENGSDVAQTPPPEPLADIH